MAARAITSRVNGRIEGTLPVGRVTQRGNPEAKIERNGLNARINNFVPRAKTANL